ncbi:anti-sigma regulatory factor [Pilimelia anulata]|uniref:Anti-sigma regulatory factor n=1 Tax=Pilimelia anulata TaxID=53371 RepID=A0A8J3B8W4_9ACTN|nr:sensor histidine kinase [Pilimelia anulata]GGK01829.1 anti-sigma regulatory factor [Pilimelia anulata]
MRETERPRPHDGGRTTVRSPAALDHAALLYADGFEYAVGVTEFVRSALADGRPVLVAVPGARVDLLRGALADVADRVTFADLAVAGRNPGRIIPEVLLTFAAAHPRQRIAVLGEPVWAGRSAMEYPACAAHEALLNVVLADRAAAVLCPYDVAALEPAVLADAARTHPVLVERGVRRLSGAYGDPLATARDFNRALPEPPADAARLAFAGELELGAVRRFVLGRGDAAGLDPDRLDDLTAAVNELAANSVEHAGGGGVVTLWREGPVVVCQVDDAGHLADPLAGRLPRPAHLPRGRGLLLANRLCDLVRVYTRPGGTSVRLHLAA